MKKLFRKITVKYPSSVDYHIDIETGYEYFHFTVLGIRLISLN